MLRLRNIVWATLLIAVLFATGAMFRTSVAQKASVPKVQNKLELGEVQVKQLLLLMDTDQNGKISKQEYMSFMEARVRQIGQEQKRRSGRYRTKAIQLQRRATLPPHTWGSNARLAVSRRVITQHGLIVYQRFAVIAAAYLRISYTSLSARLSSPSETKEFAKTPPCALCTSCAVACCVFGAPFRRH